MSVYDFCIYRRYKKYCDKINVGFEGEKFPLCDDKIKTCGETPRTIIVEYTRLVNGSCFWDKTKKEMLNSVHGGQKMKEVEFKNLGTITFGKHKGKPWHELPTNYLEFLMDDKCYIDNSLKKIAEKALQQKKDIKGQGLMEFPK